MKDQSLMLGNEAIARGLLEYGCTMATAYPGTPSSEILTSLVAWKKEESTPMHVQWAVNEKVAFEIAFTGSITGHRTAVCMKQVGLNVASDPLMSAAYMGTNGGFVIISADDPGPHSSQTEQDSRLMAMMAKIPVLDPDSPAQAKIMTGLAYELSETFKIPVMLRPTTRVCHARQNIKREIIKPSETEIKFEKNPGRWAATPKFRYQLHLELEEKLKSIASYDATAPVRINPDAKGQKTVVASGVSAAHAKEILKELNLWDGLPFYQVIQPYPLHKKFIDELIQTYDEILVIEETTGIIEMQIADRHRVRGKMDGYVPSVGELLPENILEIMGKFAGIPVKEEAIVSAPGRRPTLCAGCPHRAAFFAIKKAAPKGIYTSDIGCYTLGLNLGAVDTVLCMGAAVSQAAGFYHAFKNSEKQPDIVATLGDSTFFHAGIAPLIDTVVQKVPFVLVILDNRTTAMTGNQPTPASGFGASGEPLDVVDIEKLVRGCGVSFCKTGDPYELKTFISLVKEGIQFSKNNGPAVVIARRPCLLDQKAGKQPDKKIHVEITDDCDGCAYCIQHFECPALCLDEKEERAQLDPTLCNGCGVCIQVCPKKSIQEKK